MGTYQQCSAGSSKLLANVRHRVKKTGATAHNMTSLRTCTYAPRTPSYYKSNVCATGLAKTEQQDTTNARREPQNVKTRERAPTLHMHTYAHMYYLRGSERKRSLNIIT